MTLFHKSIIFSLSCFFIFGCASDGSLVNPFEQENKGASRSYFFGEFSDIPIPSDMSETRGDTVITADSSGTKYGTQRYSGRIEVQSLINTMRKNMSDNGWTLRSLLRSKESSLVFDKGDKVATIQISDGMIYTDMRLYVSSRLSGDAGGTAGYSASQPPQTTSKGDVSLSK